MPMNFRLPALDVSGDLPVDEVNPSHVDESLLDQPQAFGLGSSTEAAVYPPYAFNMSIADSGHIYNVYDADVLELYGVQGIITDTSAPEPPRVESMHNVNMFDGQAAIPVPHQPDVAETYSLSDNAQESSSVWLPYTQLWLRVLTWEGKRHASQPTPATDEVTHMTCMWDGCGARIQLTKLAIKAHIKQTHLKNARSFVDKDKVKICCEWDGCSLEVTNFWRHVYERHTHVMRKVPCEQCTEVFTRPGSLRRHRQRHPACAPPEAMA
ncbi:uncharacterized protein B0H18DRAFT_1126039 [Fomitopsis serialis]|uniref:uncharacterized protein n=1 Tax=Fomitopsis serialis TaxID=139415 RepID=UPI0020080D35|nr:uncharacterized protein B0H18DRAFT_1126039 [Neoantrodia serialis]KAH9913711.1 hypothetical protein B0H18DRAFT_1126039 [Neoantrodia serialis]